MRLSALTFKELQMKKGGREGKVKNKSLTKKLSACRLRRDVLKHLCVFSFQMRVSLFLFLTVTFHFFGLVLCLFSFALHHPFLISG